MFRRMFMLLLAGAEAVWRTVVKTGTGMIVANDTTESQPVKVELQGWTEQESTTGKNLFGGTLEVGWWNFSTGLKEVGSPENRYRCDDYIEIDATQEYVISSVAYDSINFWVLFYDKSKTYLNVYNHLETIPEGARYITFYCVGKDASNKLDDKVQLERGKVATSYEAYTGSAPSPSPDYPQPIVSAGNYDETSGKYQCEVKLTGKNLFDKERYSIAGNWLYNEEVRRYSYIVIPVKKGSKLSVSYAEKLPTGLEFYAVISKIPGNPDVAYEWLYHSVAPVLIKNSFTFVAESDEIYLCVNNIGANIENFMKYIGNSLQIEVSDVPTDYQPYKEQTVTLTFDRPLTKWDKLEKRNGVWGWAYKSGSYTVTGNETFVASNDVYHGEQTSSAYILNNDMIAKKWGSLDAPGGYCERLYWNSYVWNIDGAVAFTYNVNQIHIRVSNTDTGVIAEDTLADVESKIKAYVAQQYEEGNPFVFWYETAEKTFIPLSESEQEQMNELYTFRPTTVFSNDNEMFMQIEYQTKRNFGLKKPAQTTSMFNFGLKWTDCNRIILKASGMNELTYNMFFCGGLETNPFIGLRSSKIESSNLSNFEYSGYSNEIIDGRKFEIDFRFSSTMLNPVCNIWDSVWSKQIIYHEILFYKDDTLLADFIPDTSNADRMYNKVNGQYITASELGVYELVEV